jgi:hypothetical protein
VKRRLTTLEVLKAMRGRLAAAFALILTAIPNAAYSQQKTEPKPNILVIMGDDIGWFNASCYNSGMMGYRTPNIDRIANEGARFTDWYGQQSCTAGRAAFVTGQSPIRTGLTKVGLPGADIGLSDKDPSVAEVLKQLGYATGQFGKNHLGDKDEFLPTKHGFDEFFGNLYHQHHDHAENPREDDCSCRSLIKVWPSSSCSKPSPWQTEISRVAFRGARAGEAEHVWIY